MRLLAAELVALWVVAPLACASTSEQRRDYILAHPHGWVEVSLDDRAVPQVPKSEDEPGSRVRPESCAVQVLVDREPFTYGSAYPIGDSPPYSARTGFRFPAPAGQSRVEVSYSGCDVESGKVSGVIAELTIAIEQDRVSELRFDGSQLVALPPREDSVITLEDVYRAVTGGTKPAP
jgi:hypothetical protein